MPFRLAADLPFQSFDIAPLVDPGGRYEIHLDAHFPLSIQLFSYRDRPPQPQLNWHERLELFVPVSGAGRFRMGERTVEFQAGDVLVVDVHKMHGLDQFRGEDPRAVVVAFLPELVCTLGSPECDYQYLTPFYFQDDNAPCVLRRGDRLSGPAHAALRRLVDCYFGQDSRHFQAGCKAYLLEVLYLLSLHLGVSEQARAEYERSRQLAARLRTLYAHLETHYGDRISVAGAAEMVAMSESRFMRVFKRATGMTFVAYLTHVRLSQAMRLLRERDLSIAEIAAQCGFSDQSYLRPQVPRTVHHVAPGKSPHARVSVVTRALLLHTVPAVLDVFERLLQPHAGVQEWFHVLNEPLLEWVRRRRFVSAAVTAAMERHALGNERNPPLVFTRRFVAR